ncbi:DUF4279 domain-containing protein [Luteibacter sp. NPDC031894]|jgi:hypothetical protein|uniref:DUF4279 domain-containing protein n=1 Tax=Luteibacter sp. NPDC031894 TaxID=3390572 RepID=UPI003D053940
MSEPSDIDSDLRRLTPSVRAVFRLTSERHALERLLTEIELPGATTWQRGESIASSELQRRANGWCFEVPWQRTYMLDGPLAELLAMLAPHRETIVDAIRALELDAHVGLHVRMYGQEVPACFCSPASIKAVAAYQAALEVDIVPSTPPGN